MTLSKTWSLSEFAYRCGSSCSEDVTFSGFSHDSRDILPGSLYLAIKGARVDGHDFVQKALAEGAVASLAEREVLGPHIAVANLPDALAKFAHSVRQEFTGPVVGITGSNGKTSSKEFTAAALSPLGPILKNEGNRNTEYTAPLIWADLEDHKAVVSEMAMRGLGQVRHLTQFTEPTIALITMIGTAHVEMVGSRLGIAEAKSEIFEGLRPGGTAILWREDDFFDDCAKLAKATTRTFGFSTDAECQILGYRPLDWTKSVAMISLHGQKFEIEIPSIGRHQALNVAAAMLIADSCGVDLSQAANAIPAAKLPPMRMETHRFGDALVILDNYNASPDSTVAALNTFNELPTSGKKIAVIGEMRELGEFSESGHRLIGKALIGSTLDRVILYGEATRFTLDEAQGLGFPKALLEVATSLEDIRGRLTGLSTGDVVLIKGSRALELEKALEGLLD